MQATRYFTKTNLQKLIKMNEEQLIRWIIKIAIKLQITLYIRSKKTTFSPYHLLLKRKILNILVLSKFLRIVSFMLYDHTNDEIRQTSRFSTENSFRMFKSKQIYKNQVFDRHIKITLVSKLIFLKPY